MSLVEFEDLPNTTTPVNAANLNNNFRELFNLIYPVGSIYMSINNTDPGTLFGGTWVPWGTGRTPVGVDTSQTEFSTVEKTGGEKTHTLTVDEIPSHNHIGGILVNEATGGSNAYTFAPQGITNSTNYNSSLRIGNTGGGQAHNNLQPYITCYMFKRTA